MNKTNIIFFDTEFTTLDPERGQLLSLALINYDGKKELYLELEYDEDTVEPWVKKHVLPNLTGDQVDQETARKNIIDFIGEHAEGDKPYLMAYVNQFDAIYWYKLFGDTKDHPAFWIPLDFASILFAHGYEPNSLGKHSFYKELDIDKTKYKEHNALDDARMLRDIYLRFMQMVEKE